MDHKNFKVRDNHGKHAEGAIPYTGKPPAAGPSAVYPGEGVEPGCWAIQPNTPLAASGTYPSPRPGSHPTSAGDITSPAPLT